MTQLVKISIGLKCYKCEMCHKSQWNESICERGLDSCAVIIAFCTKILFFYSFKDNMDPSKQNQSQNCSVFIIVVLQQG